MTPDSRSPSDESNSPLRIERTYTDETPPSIAIIHAIAAIENTDPRSLTEELGMTLYDHLDPEALDRLATDTTELTITVGLHLNSEQEYAVQIDETGHLIVQKAV